MKTRSFVRAVCGALVVGLGPALAASCGLDETGSLSPTSDGGAPPLNDSGLLTIPDTGAPPPADAGHPQGDAAHDAPSIDASEPPDAPTTCTPNGSVSCYTVPSGFTVVAVEANATSACPSSFNGGSSDVKVGPTVPAGACACDGACTTTAQPTCPAQGTINGGYDPTGRGMCTMTLTLANTMTCNAGALGGPGQGGTVDVQLAAPAPSGGACNAPSPTEHPEQVTYSGTARICQPTSAASAGCANGVCSTSVPSPFQVCLAQMGDVACPTTPPFTTKHSTMTGVSFTCGGTCSCSVVAACTGQVDFFTNGTCASPSALQLTANGMCTALPPNGTTAGLASYSYTPGAPSGVGCTTGGTAQAPGGITPQGEVTLCCPQ